MDNVSKKTLISGAVVFATAVLSICVIASAIICPNVCSIVTIAPAAYGIYTFFKKFYPAKDE